MLRTISIFINVIFTSWPLQKALNIIHLNINAQKPAQQSFYGYTSISQHVSNFQTMEIKKHITFTGLWVDFFLGVLSFEEIIQKKSSEKYQNTLYFVKGWCG